MTISSTAAGTQTFRIAVQPRSAHAADAHYVQAAHQLGIHTLEDCRVVRLFFVQGALTAPDVERLAAELLADPVTKTSSITTSDQQLPTADCQRTIEVSLLPGVTDPVAENLVRAAHLLGIAGLEQAATGYAYLLMGALNDQEMHRLAVELFSNPVIQRYTIDAPIAPPFVLAYETDATVEIIPLCTADDASLQHISSTRRLALNLEEMQAIRAYFQHEGRDPTDAELEMLAQTWSEHCVHKTFKALITCTQATVEGQNSPEPLVIDGLLKSYIRAATERINKPWVHSAFVDNAGIIAFDEHWDLAFKVETHNHPSALEPFGGANTGVGGVVRDILGVSARPIANTDVLCFGPPDLPDADLPAGVLHPRRIADGVVHGIEDYGNKMGIPTVNGAIFYHPGYTANPLVFCGCLGLLPHNSHPAQAQPGDLIVVVGGRTGRDGLRGATFSSMEMDQTTSQVAGSAVQIGHPIHEKQVLEVVLRARDERLYNAITDCGAGGLSSAVGEMGQRLGATIQLMDVPLKYAGLRPWEIWLSEAQERMVLAVAPDNWARMQAICAGQEIEAVVIGTFEPTGRLRLYYGAKLVGDITMEFLHDGIPQRRLVAEARTAHSEPRTGLKAQPTSQESSLSSVLCALLAHPNIRSKEAVIRRYDHEVQGGTSVKPLVGVGQGPGDAAVLVPLDTLTAHPGNETPGDRPPTRGVALGVGLCPQYGEVDPYLMAWAAIDEAMRNVVAVGADPDRVALLDNFCWGNPNLPDRLGSLVQCVQGCYDAAVAYGAPFISGKDSLNNEYTGADGRRHAIPGTLLISALGIVPDVSRSITTDLKQAGNVLYSLGDLDRMSALVSGQRPTVGSLFLERLRAVHRAVQAGLVQACHDCSEGGIAVALAEMCIAGGLGARVELARMTDDASTMHRQPVDLEDSALHNHYILFGEALCRFVIEVRPEDVPAFEALLQGIPWTRIGHVSDIAELHITLHSNEEVVQVSLAQLEAAWKGLEDGGQGMSDSSVLTASDSSPDESMDTLTQAHHLASSSLLNSRPRVLILHATGTNRDRDAALACELAGGQPEIVHVNQLLAGERRLLDYHMLVVPGGFSYGDDLGAGTLWALDLRHRLGENVQRFVESGRPVLGICNGFQSLVKAGILPGGPSNENREPDRRVTLAPNESGHFECRWVYLQPNPQSACLFTRALEEPIYCPVAHGEGRVQVRDAATLDALVQQGAIALTYSTGIDPRGERIPTGYPANPNGSVLDIAGLCNAAGNVLGLMPHPENHIFPWQHPHWRRDGAARMSGLRLFINGLKGAKELC